MTKRERLYSIIECLTFGRFACEELSRSGSEAKQGCSSAIYFYVLIDLAYTLHSGRLKRLCTKDLRPVRGAFDPLLTPHDPTLSPSDHRFF
jgi:hypothetical protein